MKPFERRDVPAEFFWVEHYIDDRFACRCSQVFPRCSEVVQLASEQRGKQLASHSGLCSACNCIRSAMHVSGVPSGWMRHSSSSSSSRHTFTLNRKTATVCVHHPNVLRRCLWSRPDRARQHSARVVRRISGRHRHIRYRSCMARLRLL